MPQVERPMDESLREGIAETALAFRGYNVTNLGRTPELLGIPAYSRILREELARFGQICGEVVGRYVDLLELVQNRIEPGLDRYADSVALVVAVEAAQLRL